VKIPRGAYHPDNSYQAHPPHLEEVKEDQRTVIRPIMQGGWIESERSFSNANLSKGGQSFGNKRRSGSSMKRESAGGMNNFVLQSKSTLSA
jgi:hypothetical protein